MPRANQPPSRRSLKKGIGAPLTVHDLEGRLNRTVIEPLWGEFDAALLALAESLTIEDLLKRAAKAGLRKPVTEPLNFVI
jgi:hypothetical protein